MDTPNQYLAKNSAQLPTTEPTNKILFPTLPYPWMSMTLSIIQIKPHNGCICYISTTVVIRLFE
jgi:hypothetical protein